MGNISQLAATVTRFANCPFYLYHETETGFRRESETGLANRLRPWSYVFATMLRCLLPWQHCGNNGLSGRREAFRIDRQ